MLTETSRNRRARRGGSPGERSAEAMGPAPRAAAIAGIGLEVPAGDSENGVDEELVPIPPELAEIEALGMAEKPGRLVVAGSGSVVQGGDAKDDAKTGAVGPEASTRGSSGRGGRPRVARHVAPKIGLTGNGGMGPKTLLYL